MDKLISNREEAYSYILSTDNGFIDEIEITQDLFNDFCLVGYIKQGMDGDWRERWQVTDFGKSQLQSYINFFDQEQELSDLLSRLGIATA